MKIYYVGRLHKNVTNDFSKMQISYYTVDYVYTEELVRKELKLDNDDFEYLIKHLPAQRCKFVGIQDQKLIEILNKIKHFFDKRDTYMQIEIIYEKIESEDGNVYGKELLTGLLFPIALNPKIEYFYDIDDYGHIEKRLTYTDNNLARFKYIVSMDQVASINFINEHLAAANNKKKLADFTKAISERFNENVFKNEIIEKKKEPLLKQNEITKIMEDIEFLLDLLKKYNIELYNKYKDEYKKLNKSNENSMIYYEPSKKEFLRLLSSIKLALIICDEKCDNIIDYLNVVIEKYFIRMQTNKIDMNDLNIEDLEHITEMFLEEKDNYNIQIQRSVLKRLSLLYLLVVKTNIDKINVTDLNEGYFKQNIKTIILHISALYELGIIKNNPNFDITKDLSVETTFDMIKAIEFNQNQEDKAKKLIK